LPPESKRKDMIRKASTAAKAALTGKMFAQQCSAANMLM
jgi:hypothetical protein